MNAELIKNLSKISDVTWELSKKFKSGMNVPARLYGTDSIIKDMDETVIEQLTNVACLPGIVKYAFCMADGHSGYGFPIGGVAAFDPEKGIISPGGIGFDINCGMRLIKTNLSVKDVQPKIKQLVDTLFKMVPAGVGSRGFVSLSNRQVKEIMVQGSGWCIENGYGWKEDLDRIEEYGAIKHADPTKVSQRALGRGINQLGTLGSGNHYLEIQTAGEIFDAKTAKKFGVTDKGQVMVMVHCGSRGFGHQIATDYLNTFGPAMKKYKISVKDPELACAPFQSKEGQDYYHAMACAANLAFANRQVILHQVREAFKNIFKQDAEDMDMQLVYDVAHNIAKVEKHKVDGKKREVVVHRKGATRCFGPGNKEIAPLYRATGQPVIVGGSMETGSYLLVGTKKAEEETFGSPMHGSGRTMSRGQARRTITGEKLQKDMEKKGIYVRTATYSGLAEEAGFAYKDIAEVVKTMEKAGISKPVASLKPIGNVKG